MKPTYHIVSHSHWDREWYKSFEQFRAMLVNMVDDLLELLEGDPRYSCFTLDGQTIILDDYLAVRPERESEIRRLVAQGRLIIGPWYVLPDEFLVSGEATVRNLLLGTSAALKFGGQMNVGYIPDSFGHIATMPSVLSGFGIDTVLLYRGFGGEPGQTHSEYWWTAPDGTRSLLLHLFRHGYSAGYFHQEQDSEILARFRDLKSELDARAGTSHRLLMNGGDHHWPDPKLPQTLDLLRSNFEGEFVHSTVPRYVDAVKREITNLPEIAGELRFGYRYAFAVLGGVYSSRMYIKQRNWTCQNLLQRYVEPLNAFATARGMRSQLPLVRHAWKTLVQNHAHDSICGCSIDSVHREMMTRFKSVEDIGRSVMDLALNHLIPFDDRASKDDRYLFLVNPSSFPRSEIASADLNFYLQDIVVGLNPDVKVDPRLGPVAGFALIDSEDREVPYQITGRHEGYDITYTNYNYPKQTYADTVSILVDARDVPPLGFKGLRVRKLNRFPTYGSGVRCGKNFIENDFLRVEVNGKGEITVRDKIHREVYRGLNVFDDGGDVGDGYNYSYPKTDRRIVSTTGKAKTRLLERGPLRASLQTSVVMRIPESAARDRKSRSRRVVRLPVETTCSLTRSSRSVVIETTVDNASKDHRLRVLFPAGIKTDAVSVDSQFCILGRRRKNYDLHRFTIEHPAPVAPMQRYVTIVRGKRGLTLFTDGLPEYELLPDGRGTLALTLLRCVGLLAAEDLITRPGGKAGWHNETPEAQCPGRHSFRYAVLPHTQEESRNSPLLNEEAERFHVPLMPVRRKNPGPMELGGSFLSIPTRQLVFSALKQSEDGTAIIVRVWNAGPNAVESSIRFSRPVKDAWQARLDEQTVDRLEMRGDYEVPLHVGPHGIATMRIQFKEGVDGDEPRDKATS
jgi:mannosylglycerate hydrolase